MYPLFVMCEEGGGDSLEMLVLMPLKSAPLPFYKGEICSICSFYKGRILVLDGAICYVMNCVTAVRVLI